MKIIDKIYQIISFILFYLYKLIQANFFIAWDILTPGMRVDPAIIRVPVTIKSDFGILLFSNLLSMTPGSLSLDISMDKKFLLVHVLYNQDSEKTLKEIGKIQERIRKIVD
jgi:multisubunit Na+/H+ antiporter MnhE subunit